MKLLRLPNFIPRETLAMAIDIVLADKFRCFLTVLVIIIGVMTAITIASILTGLRMNIVHIVEEYGTNNIYAFHLSTGPQIVGNQEEEERTRKPLKQEDADAIREQAQAVENVATVLFVAWWGSTITYQGRNYPRSDMQGGFANYERTTNLALQ